MFEVMEEDGRPVKMWMPEGHELEEEARQQLLRVSRLPFVTHVSAMPDTHVGQGATIGSVIGTRGAIIPSAVGVDIGCGMRAVQLNIRGEDLPSHLDELYCEIKRAIPHGRTNDGQEGDRGAWERIPHAVLESWKELSGHREYILKLCPELKHNFAIAQLGTLGTGNHFIEICLDEEDRVWVVLHSGSRGPGARIGNVFVRKAKQLMKQFFINLEDVDLAFLPEGTPECKAYIESAGWAQSYAKRNRELMMALTLATLTEVLGTEATEVVDSFDCHHNYIVREKHGRHNIWVTRKGAVRAGLGDMGIIPGSMGAKSFIVRGKGNADSLNSCSHGAGRIMSRTEAKKTFTVDDLAEQTEGIMCSKDIGVLDEIPSSYKNIDAVMAAQTDLVEVVHTLRQVLNVKGESEPRKRKGKKHATVQ